MKIIRASILIIILIALSMLLLQCGESVSPTSNTDGIAHNDNNITHDPLGRFCVNNRFPLFSHVGDVGYYCSDHGTDEVISKECGARLWNKYVTSPTGTLGSRGHQDCESQISIKAPSYLTVITSGVNPKLLVVTFVYCHKYKVYRRIENGNTGTYGAWQAIATIDNCSVSGYGCPNPYPQYTDTTINVNNLQAGQTVQYAVKAQIFNAYSSLSYIDTWPDG